jgi:hypothetical protein
MDNIIKLIEVIIWPAVVIIMAIMADFNANLNKIEDDLDKLSLNKLDEKQKLLENEQILSSYDRFLRIAEISPRAAIMEAWRDIELATKQVADVAGISVGGNIAGVKVIRQLAKRDLLPPTVASAYDGMRKLRARAAHAADFAIEQEEAERYIETANQLFMELKVLKLAINSSKHITSADS